MLANCLSDGDISQSTTFLVCDVTTVRLKMRERKMRDQNARAEMRDHQVWKAIWRLSVQTVS